MLLRKKIKFDQTARFNYELDSNERLRIALKDLSLARSGMSKEKYLSEMQNILRGENKITE